MNGNENWMEQVLIEYAKYAKVVEDTTRSMNADPNLDALTMARVILDKKIDSAVIGYRKTIEEAKHQQADLRGELVNNWSTKDKTFKCPAGTATLRTTRSLQVKDKGKLIEFLSTLKKLPEFIKSFEIAKLRKIKDAGLLEDEIVTYGELRTVVISIKEEDQ